MEHNTLVKIVDKKLSKSPEDLDFLEYLIDQFLTSSKNSNKELFTERPDLESLYNEEINNKMKELLEFLSDKEEYEKCHRIKNIIDNIK